MLLVAKDAINILLNESVLLGKQSDALPSSLHFHAQLSYVCHYFKCDLSK